MNDQLLRERLDEAVAGIRTTSRLDDILAGPPGGPVPSPAPPRQPPRRITLIAVAAALLLIAAFTAGWVVRSAERDTTRIEIQPATTTTLGASTTDADRARVGTQISVLASTLPAGVRLEDEAGPTAGPEGTVAIRLATDGLWAPDGNGSRLRIASTSAPGYGTQWVAARDRDPVAIVQGADAYRTDGEPGSDPGWTILGWAPGPDQVIEIRSQGVDEATLLAIAESVQVSP